MKTEAKRFAKNVKNNSNKKYIKKSLVFFSTFFVSTILINGIVFSQDEQEVFIQEVTFNPVSTQANINFEDILKNTSTTKEEIIIQKDDLDFTTHYRNNASLEKGKSQVVQEGIDGQKKTIIKKVYTGEVLLSETIISEEKVRNPRDKIIEIGTKEEIRVVIPVKSTVATITTPPSKGNNGLTFQMNLYKPSGFTYEQFIKALSGNSKDTNGTIEKCAQYFYYTEQQYNINGIFLAAVAIHESGWGTSKICLDKNNLFGYGAYDSSPYDSAWTFETYAECIDLLARVFAKYYLSPDGKFYNGTTLSAVNIRYATDTGWATKVYSHMNYLYGTI